MTTKTTKSTQDQDAVAMLEAQHREVEAMFKEYEEMSDRATVKKKKMTEKICQALIMHTAIEEEIFYPAYLKALKDQDMVDEAVVEHAAAKDLIAQLQAEDPSDDLYDAKVKVLSEQIEHHVEEEEEEMFPKARKSALDLVELGRQMAQRRDEIMAAA